MNHIMNRHNNATVLQAAAETVPASQTTLQVYVDMWRDHKTCMGILDRPGGELVANVSISDRALPELTTL